MQSTFACPLQNAIRACIYKQKGDQAGELEVYQELKLVEEDQNANSQVVLAVRVILLIAGRSLGLEVLEFGTSDTISNL